MTQYTEEQMELSDMFLFLKYVNPSQYKKFIRDIENPNYIEEYQKTAE